MATSLYRMFQRRGTKQQWESTNPVLAVGEIGFAFNENVIKLGDGVTAWNSLPSVNGNSAYQVAKANGYTGTESQWLASLSSTSTAVQLSGSTMTGPLTLSGAPTSDLHAATKIYVDGLAAGINFHQPVVAATAGNLAGTYNNGTNGFGATLTKASNGSIGTIDGATVSVGNRILLRAQTDSKENGIYTITAVGSESAPWQITRATDADNSPSGELATGDFCFVTSGSTNISKGFVLSTTGTITIGTTAITYSQFNASEAVIAGSGLSKSGETLSVATGGIDTGMLAANLTFSGTVSGNPASPANANTAKAIGYIGLPQTILNSGNLTLNSAHAGNHIYVTGASQTITIPANSSVPFEIGTTLVFISNANATTTIAITSDTLLMVGTGAGGPGVSRTLAPHGMATAVKVAATTWYISGTGLT
jgi:hypothetical protein